MTRPSDPFEIMWRVCKSLKCNSLCIQVAPFLHQEGIVIQLERCLIIHASLLSRARQFLLNSKGHLEGNRNMYQNISKGTPGNDQGHGGNFLSCLSE